MWPDEDLERARQLATEFEEDIFELYDCLRHISESIHYNDPLENFVEIVAAAISLYNAKRTSNVFPVEPLLKLSADMQRRDYTPVDYSPLSDLKFLVQVHSHAIDHDRESPKEPEQINAGGQPSRKHIAIAAKVMRQNGAPGKVNVTQNTLQSLVRAAVKEEEPTGIGIHKTRAAIAIVRDVIEAMSD